MSNQDKLIKSGIKYTDAVFDEIIQRLSRSVKSTDTLEAFLEKTKDYTSSNPLQVSGYKDRLLKIILQETNSHKFSRPAQKELVRITIENRVGELIDNVGEDIKDSVRDIVKDGYNNQLSQDEIAANISSKVSSIKNKRARAIARTEIARAATVSDYIINKEMGATHFYVECRNTACPVCKEAWHNKWTPENDSSFSPSDTSAGGKGWIGDKTYSMSDTKMLPPIHVNCRCVPYFINDGKTSEKVKSQKTTSDTKQTKTKKVSKKSETKNIDPIERASIKNISYEEYPHMDFKAQKTIEYEDGTIIKFKPKVTNPEAPDWTEQTLDEITINGRTIKYKNSDKIYDDFKYMDSQLTKEELEFADEFAERYGTYAGQEFNNLKRGRISEEDLEFIKDDENYKWLNKNYEKYNKILDKCEIQEDIVTMRIQHKNYVKKGSKQIQDKGYTSTSAGVPRTNLFSDFGNARDMSDNWTFITVTPKGTKGARFHGNSLARRYSSQDEDFEKEVLYKMNKKFEILLWDEKNKIMILEAK